MCIKAIAVTTSLFISLDKLNYNTWHTISNEFIKKKREKALIYK